MILKNLLSSLKARITKPRVYALMVKFPNGNFLSIQAGYSLEEAFSAAKKELHDKNPNIPLHDISIGMFDHKGADDLLGRFVGGEGVGVGEVTPPPAKPETLEELFDKAKMMKLIVDKKDKLLFELHKHRFTENEQKYLEAKLK